MIIEIVMSILFNRRVSVQVDPITSTFARSIISSSQRRLFHPFQVVFVFPPSHPFLQGIRCSNQVSFYSCEVSSFFSFMFLPGGSHEDALQVHHCLFFFFSGGFNSNFVDHIFFFVSNVFSCRCTS